MKTEAPQYASHCVVDFWDYNNRAYSEITDDLQYPHPDGTVFDISIPQIFVGFFVGVVSLIINFVASLIISALKCIPGIFRCWCYLTKGFGEAPGLLEILLFVPYVVAMVLVPVLCFSGIVICPLFWSVYSLNCIGAMYSDQILAGFKMIFINVYKFDSDTSSLVFESNTSCVPCFDLTITPRERERAPTNARQIRRHNVVDSGVTFDRMSITTVWDHFFHMCTVNGREALGLSLCTQEDISSYEPWLIVGLPSLVLIRALKRSLGDAAIKLSDGCVLDQDNVPSDSFSTHIYFRFMGAKDRYEELYITDDEHAFVEKWLFTNGDENKCKTLAGEISSQRLVELKNMTSMIQAMAILATRVPTFHRKFGDSLDRISTEAA